MSVYAVDRLHIADGARTIVEDVAFAIQRGECVALVGASGSGKSQSCLAPFGLSPLTATGGAHLAGTDLLALPPAALRATVARDVGFVFQQPLTALTPHLTIGAQLAEAWRQAGAPRPRRADLAAALDRVGLDRPVERLDQYPHRLSGGQRQRALIAMAVAHRPRLLVADEPTSALDAALRRSTLDLLARLRAEDGLALLLVSHDLAEVAAHADRIVVLDAGHMVEAGDTAAILAAPRQAYTRALIAAAPRLDHPRPVLPAPGVPLLAARGVSVGFARAGWRRGRIAAVVDADLDIAAGESVAIVGGSGSGKSTLARAIARLGPIDRGTVSWAGTSLPPRSQMRARHRRFFQPVFQDPLASLDPRWTVAAIVAEPLARLAPELTPQERAVRVLATLAEVELAPDLADRRPGTLSGGQAQRVALARALVSRPALLVLDEATSALDVLVAARVLSLLEELRTERGLAMLVITHDLAIARRLCHRIIVMQEGRVVEAGPADQVIAAPKAAATIAMVAASRS